MKPKMEGREKQVGGGGGGGVWGRCYQVGLPVATFILMPYHNGRPDCGWALETQKTKKQKTTTAQLGVMSV